MTQALEEFFAGGVAAAKFEDGEYGTVIGGVITTEPRMAQQRDYTTNEPVFYPDGNPAMQMIVTVQADEAHGEDDGQRAFYIRGQMRAAVGEALRKVGAKTLARGGRLLIKYLEDKPVTLKNGKPGNPQKIFAARYEPPTQTAQADYFRQDQPTTRPAPGTADDMRSHAQQARPAGGAGLPCPQGVDPATWAQMNPAQRSQMYDVLGLGPTSVQQEPRGSTDEPPF